MEGYSHWVMLRWPPSCRMVLTPIFPLAAVGGYALTSAYGSWLPLLVAVHSAQSAEDRIAAIEWHLGM